MMSENEPTRESTLSIEHVKPGYWAFISYRHMDNRDEGRQWANWIHQTLETYEVPEDLVGQTNSLDEEIPQHIYPVFRDEEELPADANLADSIRSAVKRSRYMIVLCSPRAAESQYVADEITYFKQLGRANRILAVLIEGEPNASWDEGKQRMGFSPFQECFPLPLMHDVRDDGELDLTSRAEPIAADFRLPSGGHQGWTTPAAYREALVADGNLKERAIRESVDQYEKRLEMGTLRIIAGVLGIPLSTLTERDKAYQLKKAKTKARQLTIWSSVIGVLAIAAAIAAGFALHQKRQAEIQRDQVLRLSDSKEARDLIDETDKLWPIHPDKIPPMKRWLDRATQLTEKKNLHEKTLEQIRLAGTRNSSGQWVFNSNELAWQNQVLENMLVDIAVFSEGPKLLSMVRDRLRRASLLEADSIGRYASEWADCIEMIKDSPRYGGLTISPQLGLVPLGENPKSGLFEFAHVGSGSIPKRLPNSGELDIENDTAIVLALIPAGSFYMGAQASDPSRPGYDPRASSKEGPVHRVNLTRPFFISLHECTQQQWNQMTGGESPSAFRMGRTYHDVKVTGRHPVEHVSYLDAMKWLHRHRLTLPTEAQWEYCCRAGTATAWWTGDDVELLGVSEIAPSATANVADKAAAAFDERGLKVFSHSINDGYPFHSPVGSFRPNPFGLYDVHGNVWEWCRDGYRIFTSEPQENPVGAEDGKRTDRGGSWYEPAEQSRCSVRFETESDVQLNILGLRAAMELLDP